jgi:hypothetical protein
MHTVQRCAERGAQPVLLVKWSILPRHLPVWGLHEDRRHAIINQLSIRCGWSAHLTGCGGNGRISNERGVSSATLM